MGTNSKTSTTDDETEVSPEIAARILAENQKNSVAKVADGGTLNAREAETFAAEAVTPEKARENRAKFLLLKWSNGKRLSAADMAELCAFYPDCAKNRTALFANSFTELADILDVTRQTLTEWREKYASECPRCDERGVHSVEKWRKFLRKKGFSSRTRRIEQPKPSKKRDADAEKNTADDLDPETTTREELNRQLIREKVRRERIKADLESGAAVLVAEIEVPLGALLAAIKNGIDAYPDRAAPMVQGFEDVPEIAGILHGEMQSTIGQLRIADFEHALEDVEESIRPAVEDALRKIGRKAMETHCKRTP